MTKEAYIDSYVSKQMYQWSGIAFLTAAFLNMLLGFLDYIVTPDNFKIFLQYRSVVSVLLILMYFFNRRIINRNYQTGMIILATTFISIMIEMMILKFGGHQSPYFAGLILTVIYALGFMPISIIMSVCASLIIYGIYLIPIILYDTISNKPFFISINVFILSIISFVLIWKYYSLKGFVNEVGLQYDLEQQKKQLKVYSTQLEGIVQDRTKELRKSEQWHRNLVDNATDGIVVLDRNGIIVNVNNKACEMHEFAQNVLVGTHIRLLEGSFKHEELAERMRRLLNGESLVFESTHHKKDGTPLYLEISSKAIEIDEELYIQSFYRDISEKKKLQEHLFQSQKMDSVGVLAGGIAHDFNNILTAILGHCEILRRVDMDQKSLRSLNVIEDASRRAGRMISKLLGFARKSNYEIVTLNMNNVIFDTVKLLERVIDKKINLTVDLDNTLPMIRGDLNQMEQVVMNLIVNARDAMPNGGRIVLKTTFREVRRGMLDVPPYIPEGDYVVTTIADTGSGIPAEIVNKIFEPFFTTKERGKGTGLGLSMVYGAVKEHRGYITVHSELGRGTTFMVYLPAAPATVAAQPRRQPSAAISGSETILIVDDEEDILAAIRDILSNHGYKVLPMSDPSIALSFFEKMFRDVALVITDIVMPTINGKEFIGRIKAISPDVKVLAISGYTKYVAPKDEIGEINGFLQKPFESYYLLSVVRRILDARPHDILLN